eukprot:4531442-Pyramimonas_sp.AAC.1
MATAMGNMAAGIWAGRAAVLAWERGATRDLPRTKAVDFAAAMIRRRARRALKDSAAVETLSKAERDVVPIQSAP